MERTRGNTSDSKSDASRGTTIVQTLEWLMTLELEALAAVQPLLSDLADLGSLPPSVLRRLAFRAFCVQQFRELRRSAAHRHLRAGQLIKLLNQGAVQHGMEPRCRRRTLQGWIRAWNTPGPDGVALGWRGLIRPYRPADRSHFGRPGRESTRSPEAVAFFERACANRRDLTVAECHRLTLAEAARRGWCWPEACAATRAWLKGRGRNQ